MSHKRIHIRVPVIGDATISDKSGMVIQAKTIDISAGGIRIASPLTPLEPQEYEFRVTTLGREVIAFKAEPVHSNDKIAGFQITDMGSADLHNIYLLINDFQATEDFIKHIDEHNIIHDWLIDDFGAKLDVTFEVDNG